MRDARTRLRVPYRPDRSREEGLTLVELLVSMVIFGVALSVVYPAVLLVQRQVGDVAGSAEAASQVRLALAQIDRQVRSGNVLYSPEDEKDHVPSCESVDGSQAGTCMRVYTQADGVRRCVQWQVLPDVTAPGTDLLRSRSWRPNWTTEGGVSDWSTVARGLVPDPSVAPFRLEADGTYGSRLLEIHLEALDRRRAGDPVILSSSLSGRNTSYGYDAGQCTPVPTE